jgi:drug/metabolite transporter (DMT)-like permease
MNKKSVHVILIFTLLCMIWGSTWLAIRFSLLSLTPMYSSGLRFLIAAIIISIIMKLSNIKIQKDRKSVRLFVLQGIFSFMVPFGLVYWAEQFIPSGLAAVLFAVYPFSVALFSYFLIPAEKIGIYKIIGMVLGFTGILIIFGDDIGGDFSSYLLGMIAVVLSGTLQAFMAVTIKKHGFHLHPLSMNLVPMAMAGVFLLAAAFLFEDVSRLIFDLNAALSVLYLAIFGSIITFTGYYWLLKKLNVVILSMMAFITPLVALILGWLIMNEQLTSNDIYGSVLVLTGLITANVADKLKDITVRLMTKKQE